MSDTPNGLRPWNGEKVCIWRHQVSNYGHMARTNVLVVGRGPKRVRVQFTGPDRRTYTRHVVPTSLFVPIGASVGALGAPAPPEQSS